MSQIPDPIRMDEMNNEGQVRLKTERDLIVELIEKFNELVIYLDSISERL